MYLTFFAHPSTASSLLISHLKPALPDIYLTRCSHLPRSPPITLVYWVQTLKSPLQCPTASSHVTSILTQCNLVGCNTRINDLKGILFGMGQSGLPKTPDWSKYLEFEVALTIQYLNNIHDQFFSIVTQLGIIMDHIWEQLNVQPSVSATPSVEWKTYAAQRFSAVYQQLQDAINGRAAFLAATLLSQVYNTKRTKGP